MREEEKLDRLLTEEAGELPPPPEVDEEITPWKRAIRRIVWGIGLTTCTLNFWIIQYLMVAVGTVLLWLGFRALRRENRCFTVCWVISLIEAALQFTGFILNATIWGSEHPLSWLSYSILLLPLIQYICLWQGIIEVRRRAGQPPKAGAAGALIWFYLVLVALALLNVQGLIIVGALLVIYILILRSLSKFAHLLDEAGYQVQPAPVRVSDRSIWIIWFAALLICIPTATLLFGRYPMDWFPRPEGEQAGLEAVRSHLVELGMPEQVTDDLSAEDLSSLEEALRVEVEITEEPFNDGQEVRTSMGTYTYVHTEYVVKEMKVTNLAVELPGKRWQIIHHFQWQVQPQYHTTECIVLWPAARTSIEGYRMDGTVTGRLLYDMDGTTYLGDYYRLNVEDYTTDSIFWGTTENQWPMALFSLPLDGENCRGYLTYEVKVLDEGWILNSWMNYTHQVGFWNYPLMTAEEHEKRGLWNGMGGFQTSQTAIQFFPHLTNKETEEDPA